MGRKNRWKKKLAEQTNLATKETTESTDMTATISTEPQKVVGNSDANINSSPAPKDLKTEPDGLKESASGVARTPKNSSQTGAIIPLETKADSSRDNTEVNTLTQKSMIFLDIMEKIAKLVKSGKDGQLLAILQKVVSLLEHEDKKKGEASSRILNVVLENLEDAKLEYLKYYQERLKGISFAKGLRERVVTENSLKDIYIELGRGAFGIVTKGILKKSCKSSEVVAIKQATDPSYVPLLIEEAQVMSQFDHEIILKLLAVTVKDGSMKLALELMDLGDLINVILGQQLRFTASDLLVIIHDVSSGMEYLTGKGYIHRDLKCKNVFINAKKECKIGDFGLCKYVGNSNGVFKEKKMRINGRHVAPESRHANKFTRKSDVWAMGALIWDLYAIAASQSLFQLQFMMPSLWDVFMSTNRLPQSEACPTDVHNYTENIILHRNPAKRPEFGEIKNKIVSFVQAGGAFIHIS